MFELAVPMQVGAHACTSCGAPRYQSGWDALLLVAHVVNGTNYCTGHTGTQALLHIVSVALTLALTLITSLSLRSWIFCPIHSTLQFPRTATQVSTVDVCKWVWQGELEFG